MIRRIFHTLCLAMLCLTALAQDEQQQINLIKSNPDYLYAMGTSTVSDEEASCNAVDLLALEIENWLEENGIGNTESYVSKSRENVSQIKTKRANLHRVFAFIDKNKVLSFNTEEKKTPETTVAPAEETYTPTLKERIMLNVSTFTELNDYVNAGRADETITDVGKYSNLPKSGIVYAFIHNRQGNIPACLKITDGTALNLRTGKSDKISNYKGCGAIWIKFKEE